MDTKKPKNNQDSLGQNRRGYYIDGISPQIRRKRRSPEYGYRSATRPAVRPSIDSPVSIPAENIAINQRQEKLLPNKNNRPSLMGTNLISSKQYVRAVPKHKKRIKRVIKPAIVSFAVLVVGAGLWLGTSVLRNVDKVFHGNVFSDAHALISGSSLKESNGRVNILLAGDSADDPGHNGATLADSIMVISYDVSTKSGFILSIPRDLWVDVPTMGGQKINAANDVASFSEPGYPSGGMGALQQIVQNDLGIPIDYEALINYAAFKDAVDTVGGITININSPDPRGLYDAYTHLKLPNGMVNLTGQEALDLARARGDNVAGDISYGFPDSDFTRTMYQREMLKALFKKALSVGVLSNPLKISSLFNSFSSNVQTNLSLGDAISLAKLSGALDLTQLQSEAYSYGGSNALLTNYFAPNGQEALIPSAGINNYSQLREFYMQLTSSKPIVR